MSILENIQKDPLDMTKPFSFLSCPSFRKYLISWIKQKRHASYAITILQFCHVLKLLKSLEKEAKNRRDMTEV